MQGFRQANPVTLTIPGTLLLFCMSKSADTMVQHTMVGGTVNVYITRDPMRVTTMLHHASHTPSQYLVSQHTFNVSLILNVRSTWYVAGNVGLTWDVKVIYNITRAATLTWDVKLIWNIKTIMGLTWYVESTLDVGTILYIKVAGQVTQVTLYVESTWNVELILSVNHGRDLIYNVKLTWDVGLTLYMKLIWNISFGETCEGLFSSQSFDTKKLLWLQGSEISNREEKLQLDKEFPWDPGGRLQTSQLL